MSQKESQNRMHMTPLCRDSWGLSCSVVLSQCQNSASPLSATSSRVDSDMTSVTLT